MITNYLTSNKQEKLIKLKGVMKVLMNIPNNNNFNNNLFAHMNKLLMIISIALGSLTCQAMITKPLII